MTEPKDSAADEAARAEAEAAAMAANEVDADEAPDAPEASDDALAADEPAAEDGADGDEVATDELDDDELEAEDEAEAAAPDEEAEEAGVAAAGAGAAASTTTAKSGRASRDARSGSATQAIPIDPSIRVRDNASKYFVIGTVLVFVLIFANGIFFGTGGVFTPYVTPSPSPSPSETVAPSVSIAPSGSPAASGSVAPSRLGAPPSAAQPGPVGLDRRQRRAPPHRGRPRALTPAHRRDRDVLSRRVRAMLDRMTGSGGPDGRDRFSDERARMVERQLRQRGIADERVSAIRRASRGVRQSGPGVARLRRRSAAHRGRPDDPASHTSWPG
jgi:hypothetical protein